MTDTETVYNTTKKYRDHYITVRALAEPPLPHEEHDDSAELRVRVRLYDRHPGMGSFGIGSRPTPILEREHPVTASNIRESIGVMIDSAKDRVDGRIEQADMLEAEAAIAVEDELGEDDDDGFYKDADDDFDHTMKVSEGEDD